MKQSPRIDADADDCSVSFQIPVRPPDLSNGLQVNTAARLKAGLIQVCRPVWDIDTGGGMRAQGNRLCSG